MEVTDLNILELVAYEKECKKFGMIIKIIVKSCSTTSLSMIINISPY